MLNLGMVRPGSTIYIPFDTFDGGTGASITMTGLAVTDIEVYKDGSVTQRASDAGYTLLDTDGIDFDALTGIHGFSINLADNTTAGFWAAGSAYFVVVSSITVDAQTVSFIAAYFSIGYPSAVLNTTIATLSTQTSFTLTNGPAEDDALNGRVVVIHDVASAVQLGYAIISDYTGSTKTVTLAAATTFTVAASDNIAVLEAMPLIPTVAGRTLDVATTGEAGVDFANINGTLAAANIAADAFTAAKFASDVATEFAAPVLAVLGALADAAADGDPTSADTVMQYVKQLVNTLVGTAGIVTFPAAAAPANAISLAEVVRQIYDEVAGLNGGALLDAAGVRSAVGLASANLDTQLDALPTAAENADAVWDEATSGHVTAGTFGQRNGIVRANTAQAGSGTTITLDASASAVDDFYNNTIIFITGGTGAGQSRIIEDYVGATKVATVAAWATNPSSDSVFVILPFGSIPGASAPTAAQVADAVWDELLGDHVASGSFGSALTPLHLGTAQAGAAGTITLVAGANANDDFYNGSLIKTLSGTGALQSRFITDYNGTTKVATVDHNWVTNPDATTVYIVLPFSTIPGATAPTAAEVADAVWDEDATGHQTQGSFGQAIGDPGADSDTIWGLANTNLNATVGSRASQTSVDTVDDFLDTEIASIISSLSTIAGALGALTDAAADGDPTTTDTLMAYVKQLVNVLVGTAGIVTWAAGAAPANGVSMSEGLRLLVERLGTPAGASIAADLVVIDDFVDNIESRLGVPSDLASGATIAANLVDIEAQTDDIGAAGAGLTALASQASVNTIDDFLDTEVAAIKAKTDQLTFTVAGQVDANALSMADALITAAKIATGAIDADAIAADGANEIADALLDRTAGVETNRTVRQALRLMLAALVGELSGAATTTITIRDTNDSLNRIVATVDADGNRSALTLDAS